MRYLCLAVLAVSSLGFGQAITATPAELKYLRFMLINVASLDHGVDAIANYESSLVLQFGLSSQESATIHSAGQTLHTVLAQLRASTQTLVAGTTSLTAADTTALANINAHREQQIASLANQVLNSVSATTAGRLRTPGNIMAAAIKGN